MQTIADQKFSKTGRRERDNSQRKIVFVDYFGNGISKVFGDERDEKGYRCRVSVTRFEGFMGGWPAYERRGITIVLDNAIELVFNVSNICKRGRSS